ncbi:holo-ACP synthase [Pradoshia sp.]|uniref:holo-ACP synthase n=1 Tax=Pradoshia sp. TaxID=2651281 RepID=UPI003F0DE7F7
MIQGIGLDIVELDRVRDLLDRKPKFASRILTPEEMEIFESLGERRRIEWFAGRFSAKEAFSKAVGTGIGKELSFQDISIIQEKSGKPIIRHCLSYAVHLSITHTSEYAAAQVILEDRSR